LPPLLKIFSAAFKGLETANQRFRHVLAGAAIVRITHQQNIGPTEVLSMSKLHTASFANRPKGPTTQPAATGNPMQRSLKNPIRPPPTSLGRHLCLVVLMTLAVSACTNRIVYDNADWWLNWYIDDYVQFNREQQRTVDRYLDQQMQWHRQSQLPRYEAFLQQTKKDFSGELNVTLVRARFEAIYQFWRDFVGQAMPASASVLAQLDDKQANRFIANIEKETRGFEKDYADSTPEKLARDQQKNTEKTLKNWIGKLSDEQSGIISRWAHAMKNVYPASIKQRKQWQEALALALRERNRPELFEQRLRVLFITPSDSWSPEYKALVEANEILTAQMVVDIHHSLTPQQKTHLLATVDGYIDDIHKLQKER